EVKFDSGVSRAYQIQGIIADGGGGNFLRFDSYSNGWGVMIFSAAFTNGYPVVKANRQISGGAPLYIKVRRVGDQWTQYYSYDGITWTTNVSFTHAINVKEAGIFAGNAGSYAPAYTALVDYFLNIVSQ
ncbi:MAG: hypothetical protein C4560_09630, partial [Nitrospiraceae bacterium]